MKNKQYIKRCPFCGGKAGLYETCASTWCVQCNKCGISTLNRRDYKSALLDWNRRISDGVKR